MDIQDPLTAATPSEVPLANAPLVRVIAQMRFPVIAAIEKQSFVSGFQESLREQYPVLRREVVKGLVVGPEGIKPVPDGTVWRFSNLDQTWRVSLAPDFMALETTAYQSRTNFLAQLRDVSGALEKHVSPKVIDRIGLRYIDRVTGSTVDDIAKLIRPDAVGLSGGPLAGHVQHAISEMMLTVSDNAGLLARWGKLPPHGTVDPTAIEPIGDRSWILDLDMFSTKPAIFSETEIMTKANLFAERLYTFFRWFVSEEFLRRYGSAT